MKTLIIFAHGSRSAASNDEVRALASRLARDGAAARVDAAYLELAEPSLLSACAAAVAGGATELTILPFFLNAGRHVTRDVPAQVAEVREAHPEVPLQVLTHVGGAERFYEAVLAHSRD